MTPLPDSIRDAIAAAARQTKRRAERLSESRIDHTDLEGFVEDITDEMIVPVGELVDECDRLRAAMEEATRLLASGCMMMAEEHLTKALDTHHAD